MPHLNLYLPEIFELLVPRDRSIRNHESRDERRPRKASVLDENNLEEVSRNRDLIGADHLDANRSGL